MSAAEELTEAIRHARLSCSKHHHHHHILFMNQQLHTIVNKTKSGSQKILRSSELAAYNY